MRRKSPTPSASCANICGCAGRIAWWPKPPAQVAGFCISAQQDHYGYIVTIDVLEEFRRHKVGTALLDEIERRLIASGVHEVRLETATDNDSAVAFWQKHGYRKRGIRKNYYPNGRDAFAMIKTLALAETTAKKKNDTEN